MVRLGVSVTCSASPHALALVKGGVLCSPVASRAAQGALFHLITWPRALPVSELLMSWDPEHDSLAECFLLSALHLGSQGLFARVGRITAPGVHTDLPYCLDVTLRGTLAGWLGCSPCLAASWHHHVLRVPGEGAMQV